MGRMLAIVISLFAAVGASAAPPPGPPQFHVLRTSDGSPSNMPQAIVQDHDGFIWIGTRHGLARYDGTGFRHWQHDPRDPASLPDNDVTVVIVDRLGRLWCGTEGGGVVLMREDGRFRRFRHIEGDARSLGDDNVLALAEGRDGSIWVGTHLGGLARIDINGHIERIAHSTESAQGLRSNFVISLLVDASGRLWIGSDAGLDVRTPDGRIRSIDLPPMGAKKVPASMVAGLFAETNGDMLVGLRGGVVRVGADLVVKGSVGAPINATVTAFARGDDGQLWATTTQGLVREDGAQWRVFAAGEHASGEVPGTRSFGAMRDREGNLWFAFVDGGLARLSSQAHAFEVWRHRYSDTASLAHSRLSGVAADPNGGAWAISDTDGLDRLAPDGSVTRHGSRIPNDAALRSVAATATHVFIGRWRGILRYAPASGRVDDIEPGTGVHALAQAPVSHMQVAPDGTLWAVARSGGVSRIDPLTLAVHTYSPALGTLGHADIYALSFDGAGSPWVVGKDGFERFDARSDRFVRASARMTPVVESFAFAADGSIWLHRPGSLEHHRVNGDGLERIDLIDVDDGWSVTESNNMHVAADGDVWVGSFQGLWRLDPATRTLRRYGEGDGLPSSEMTGAPFGVGGGTIYAGTLGGLVAFDPARVVASTVAPRARITTVTLRRDGQPIELDARHGEVSLAHGDRDLFVQARSLSFSAPGSHRFMFRLKPYETEWVDVGAAGARLFSQLPSGLHSLAVRVTDADGNTSEMAEPLTVRVAPAPWWHPLAWLAYAVLAALVGVLASRVQRRRVEQRHALAVADEQRFQAERLGASKSAFLATMSHEIRTPMTSMLGMAELLQLTALDSRQRGYAEAISSSGELLLRLVNDSLDLARIEAGKLALEPRIFAPVALVGEVVALGLPLAARNRLDLRVEHANDIPPFVVGDPLRIKQVLLNLLGNALKFTERGGVVVRLARAPAGGLAFAVSDSGPGMAADMLDRLFGRFEQSVGISQRFGGSGLGLAITRELVELMEGRIVVESAAGSGTTFTVELPLADAEAPVAAAVVVDEASAKRPLVVMVVEDDATIARVLTGLLESLGHRVLHAANGLTALAGLAHGAIDVALVDLDLPGIDGLQLARVVRQREKHEHRRLPLIAISARALGNEEEHSRAAGMDAFLRKPLTVAMLDAALAPWTAAAPRSAPGEID